MSNKDRTAWCRKKGIFAHNLDQWKKDALSAMTPTAKKKQNETEKSLKKEIISLKKDLSRKNKAAQLLGLTIRTIQRWNNKGLLDRRKGSRAAPGNKLSDFEKAKIAKILESPQFADSKPNQIVPKLADQGIYIGSE